MTIAQQFIADTKGKTVKEISEIEERYYENGWWVEKNGLSNVMHLLIYPSYLQNRSLAIDVNYRQMTDALKEEEQQSIAGYIKQYLVQSTGFNMCEPTEELWIVPTGFTDDAYYDPLLDGHRGNIEVPMTADMVQEILTNPQYSRVIGGEFDWHLIFTWETHSELNNSSWEFSDGSTCEWKDISPKIGL